jgi:hypothetical protein
MTLFNLLSLKEPPKTGDRYFNETSFQNNIDSLDISDKFKKIIKKMTAIQVKDRFKNLEEIERELTPLKKRKKFNIVTEIDFDKEYNNKIDEVKKSDKSSKGSWFKNIIIILLLAIVSYGGYREYIKIKSIPKPSVVVETPTPEPKVTPPIKGPKLKPSKVFTKSNIKSFLESFLKSGESNSPQKSLQYYASKVDRYFTLKNVTREDIFDDKVRFYKKWYQRKYNLIDFTIIDTYSKNGIEYCNLTQTISWKVLSSSYLKFGKSVDWIALKSENNRFQIVSIYNLSSDVESTPIPTPEPVITLDFNRQNIKKFLEDFLITKEGYSAENIANYFSPIVENYRGTQNLTTEDIIQRKRNWINMWKSRHFRLVNFEILQTYFRDGIEYCDLEEIVEWKHQKLSSAEYISGTNKIGITITRSDNSFKITSIYTIKSTIRKNFNKESIRKFLISFLRVKEKESAEDIANYFSPTVKNYYGTYNLITKDIIKRKKNWISMWKSREFRLINFDILNIYSKDGIEYCDLKENVEWKHSKHNSTTQAGSSTILMTLKKENSDFKIVSIYKTN